MRFIVALCALFFIVGVVTTIFLPRISVLDIFRGREIFLVMACVWVGVFVIAIMPLFVVMERVLRAVSRVLVGDPGAEYLTSMAYPLWALACLLSMTRSLGVLAVAVTGNLDAAVMGLVGIVFSILGLVSVRLASGKWWPGFTKGGKNRRKADRL